jgi:hypothetical protein
MDASDDDRSIGSYRLAVRDYCVGGAARAAAFRPIGLGQNNRHAIVKLGHDVIGPHVRIAALNLAI